MSLKLCVFTSIVFSACSTPVFAAQSLVDVNHKIVVANDEGGSGTRGGESGDAPRHLGRPIEEILGLDLPPAHSLTPDQLKGTKKIHISCNYLPELLRSCIPSEIALNLKQRFRFVEDATCMHANALVLATQSGCANAVALIVHDDFSTLDFQQAALVAIDSRQTEILALILSTKRADLFANSFGATLMEKATLLQSEPDGQSMVMIIQDAIAHSEAQKTRNDDTGDTL